MRARHLPGPGVSLAVLVLAGGCVEIPGTSRPPSAKVSSIRRDQTNATAVVSATVLGAELGRFADELYVVVSQAADVFARQVGTAEARAIALSWRSGAANNSMIIASGANPTANLLDMIVLVTLGRMTVEEYWVPHYGKPAEPMLEACRKLESEIWRMASPVLSPAQQEELRGVIRAWRDSHPDQIYIGVRLRDFAEVASLSGSSRSRKPGSVFGLLFLDPFSGLDPATREMAQTRYFFERALFVFQRMPTILRLQSELVVNQSLASPDLQQVLSNSTRFVEAAERVTRAVEKLPEQLSAEREKLMSDAAAQAPQWQALLAQLEATLKAGNEMAASVRSTTESLDSFVGRFDSTNRPPSSRGPSQVPVATNQVAPAEQHFDVTEYGAAAAQVANAAQKLDTLISSLDQSTPRLNDLVIQTRLQGKELVDYAFRKALWFLALALIGLLLMMVGYRLLAARISAKEPTDRPGT